ncbi:MAG: hypothetical protein ACXQS8_09120, partial [Candidatus Helarchaeales archaeon]
MNVDIFGLVREDLIQDIEDDEFEFFKLEKLEEGDIQEMLVLLLPEKKKGKLRKKGYRPEEVAIIRKYLEEGGIVIIIAPMEEKFSSRMLELQEEFEFTPVINEGDKLLHGNINLIYFIRRKDGKYGNVKRHVTRYAHFVTAMEDLEILFEGNYLPVVCIKKIGQGQLVLYGLSEEEFWTRDLKPLSKYLFGELDDLWEQVEDELEFFEALEKNERIPEDKRSKIYASMAKNVLRKRSFKDVMNSPNPTFCNIVLDHATIEDVEREFKDVHPKDLTRQYAATYEMAKKIGHEKAIQLLNSFMFKKIEERQIDFDSFDRLLKRALLPEDARL